MDTAEHSVSRVFCLSDGEMRKPWHFARASGLSSSHTWIPNMISIATGFVPGFHGFCPCYRFMVQLGKYVTSMLSQRATAAVSTNLKAATQYVVHVKGIVQQWKDSDNNLEQHGQLQCTEADIALHHGSCCPPMRHSRYRTDSELRVSHETLVHSCPRCLHHNSALHQAQSPTKKTPRGHRFH